MKTNSVISIPWLMTACAVLLLCGSTSLAQTIVVRYVDASAAPSGDGTSWSTAYDNLQTALANTNPSESEIYQLWVAAGTYNPTSGTDRTISFSMKNRVELYGGFNGTESFLEEQDWETNITILSGDLNDDDEPDFGNRTDNSYHVAKAEGVNTTARLDGFTITGGYADTSASGRRGAGLYIVEKDNPHPVPDDPSSPRVFNCKFVGNVARSATGAIGVGGAVYSSPSSTTNTLVFTNCAFLDNQTALSGGAVYLANMNAASFSSCEFIGNSTTRLPTSGAGTHGGGGLYVSGSAGQMVTIVDSVFRQNFASAGEGGALYCVGPKLTVRRCDFIENVANYATHAYGRGGGAFVLNALDAELIDCRFHSNASIILGTFFGGGGLALIGQDDNAGFGASVVNCEFIANQVGGTGGGYGGGLIHFKTSLHCVNSLFAENLASRGAAAYCDEIIVEFINCTIANNFAADTGGVGGIDVASNHQAEIHNSILWGNRANSVGGSAAQIQQGDHNVTYSCIEGGFGGTGNINSDPLFVDPANGNYRLQPCSPASDAADYDIVPPDEYDVNDDNDIDEATPDLDKKLRAVDNPFRDDDGAGTYEYTDMGAFELHVPACELFGDLEVDASVDGLDIAPFVNCILGVSQDCTCADINRSGAADYEDIACFVQLLLYGTGCIDDCNIGLRSFPDCNGNGIHDANDIFNGDSVDCNANGIPDECEIDAESAAPGGPYFCTEDCAADVNDNGVPDECEPDCNHNGIPDAWDISEETSVDVNTNGIPDECELDCNTNGLPDDWDIAEATSADCNGNGIPDECEYDCNENGVPDDCDVDPSDPDGDEWVSPDCNGNEYPDECDLSLAPPFGSFDCNENGIPDECDLAACDNDPACDDCNENGIPDGCDIAAEISEDVNENGIPDECEGESFMMGDGEGGGEAATQSEQSGALQSPEEDAAWEAFYDWVDAQCWGGDCEDSAAEQFRRVIDKKRELGLPLERS